jgi:hypothetical protein
MRNISVFMLIAGLLLSVTGCGASRQQSALSLGGSLVGEPEWVRNGEPVRFEGEDWYPTDEVENLFDSEVYKAGEYRSVIIYLEKVDVRPFARIYLYFGPDRYRACELRQ